MLVDQSSAPAWYAVHTQPNREALARASLHRIDGVEVFFPRIRYRLRRPGAARWQLEPLFPGYLFAFFPAQTRLRAVHYSDGVSRVVQFGDNRPAIPAAIINQLRSLVGADQIKEVTLTPNVGEEVEVAVGPMAGLSGIVTKLIPARQRVVILLNFLGSQSATEVAVTDLRYRCDLGITARRGLKALPA